MLHKKIILCSLVILFSMTSQAQLYSRLTSEYAHIDSVFLNPVYQRFNINYYYSTEKNPTVFTDSLNASFQVHQGNYFGYFGNNAVMQNSQYLLSFYGANGTIMVSNPVKHKTGAMQGVNFDSAFLATNVDSAWISDLGTIRSIQYRFTDLSPYKNCTVTYNKNNYELQKIVYCMKQQMLDPADTVNLPANPYVTILFSGFSQTAFNDSIFDHNRYVMTDSSGGFRGVGSYVDYEVLSTYRTDPDTVSGGPTSMLRISYNIPALATQAPLLRGTRTSFAFICPALLQTFFVSQVDSQKKDKLVLINKKVLFVNKRYAALKS